MSRSPGLLTWSLLGLGAFAGCRVGYDEISILRLGTAGNGGSTGGVGVGGTVADAGEAGADATGGTSVTGGTGGVSMGGGAAGASTSGGSGGSATTGGTGGATGGKGGASASGGAGGASGGSSNAGAGGASGGKGGNAGAAGASGAATSGAGGAGAGGAAGSSAGGMGGASGTLGQGGFAGATSLGDCLTATFGGHDYVFCNVNVAWTVARDNCASVGMFLVRVDDAAESQWVYDNVYDAPPRQGVWIGGNDLAMEGEWRWGDGALFWLGTSTGSAQGGLFTAWHPSQPSGQGPRDCAALDGNALGWYDLDCATPQPYACESP